MKCPLFWTLLFLSDVACNPKGRYSFEEIAYDVPEYNQRPSQTELDDAFGDLPRNGDLFEGDMVMDSGLKAAILGIEKKSAIVDKNRLWPDGILYYVIDPHFRPSARKLLAEAMNEFETRTCIRFVKRTNQKDYVYYTGKQDVCSSNIGRTGKGKQTIHLGKDCEILGTFLHETMHAIGCIHEHSRPDREKYLDVKWNNIKKSEWNNFQKYELHSVKDMGIAYNFASVMHYRNDAFTKNGKDTLSALSDEDLKFGQRIKWSVGDVKQINRLYNCKVPPKYDNLFKDMPGETRDEEWEVTRY